ncbi:MAG: hypothetical protein EOO15_14220 [Chitinophagaceae bacterium]|nr:MAG: hypothetical protein EOO15_14220 [Chitinophagaceae bacterium]
MAEFLTTNGTSFNIENVIIDAKAKLVLVSPYLQISKTFYERLKDASNRKVSIKIIYGKDELKPNEKNSLAELENIELFYFENLHAKCYFNESKMVITSMNMYEFSEKNNREMGVLIDQKADRELFDKAVNEVKSILQSSEKILLRKAERSLYSKSANSQGGLSSSPSFRGYCIRCKHRISYNSAKPYCVECFSVWSQWENLDYIEEVCHRCGEYEQTSFKRPQCYDCYCQTKGEPNSNRRF